MKKSVAFSNNQIRMAGELFTPDNLDETTKIPAIVCTHPAGAVKEQSPALYAEYLAEMGFIVLTFDASHQGASGGEPRFLENPFERVDDIRSAIDYLTSLPFVDASRIGAFGICAGGGYSVSAATTERRIKAVAGVSATDAGSAIREGWDGSITPAEQIKMLESVAAQRTAEANGGEIMYMAYVPETIDETTAVTMREAHEYYRTPRAQHPNSQNKVMFTSLDRLLTFSATDRIDSLLTQPLLMIVGSESDAMHFSQKFYEKAASEKKELFIVENATHIDLYDVMTHVKPAIRKLGAFFTENL